ncbi:MAG: hypothetical protein ACR2PW_04605 [Gammaproteobacteria bacterium]
MTDTDQTGADLADWLDHLANEFEAEEDAIPCFKALRRTAGEIRTLRAKVAELEATIKVDGEMLVAEIETNNKARAQLAALADANGKMREALRDYVVKVADGLMCDHCTAVGLDRTSIDHTPDCPLSLPTSERGEAIMKVVEKACLIRHHSTYCPVDKVENDDAVLEPICNCGYSDLHDALAALDKNDG